MINGALCYPSRAYCTSSSQIVTWSLGKSCVHEAVSVCLCMYLCFHCVHMCTCMLCTCVPLCAHVCACVHVCVPVPTLCARVHLCVNVCVLVCLCVPFVHVCTVCVCAHISVCACVCVSVVREEICCKDSSGGAPRRGCRLCSGSHIFRGRWSYPQVYAPS